MLSLGKLAPGQQEYYVDTVARGAEEYYTGAKEAPGQWVGAAAARLGLDGEVDAEVLGNVLGHVDPTGVYRLTAARSVPTVAGFDATFCAPKSVSLLFALGRPDVSNEVRNAADAAVGASLSVLEEAACRVRRGKGGHTVLDGDGFVGAAFRHRTSRAGDPHLHTHVVERTVGTRSPRRASPRPPAPRSSSSATPASCPRSKPAAPSAGYTSASAPPTSPTTAARDSAGRPPVVLVDRALDAYIGHDRVHQAVTDDAVRDRLVDQWMNARVGGEDVLMVAARLSDVDDLNRRARHTLWDECYLGEDEVVLGGRPFAVCDEVLALRNDYQLGLLNGTRATVEHIDTTRNEMTLTTTAGEALTVPFAYAEAGHLTHGYATTVHKAQGATVDRCFVLVDETMTREHAYTALSRGRDGNELFIVAQDQRVEEGHANEVDFDPLDAVRRVIGRSGAKRMAADEIEPSRVPL